MSDSKHSVRFPGESERYRAARNELLEAEIQLRRNIEAVAAQRRNLPLGGKVPEDYVFDEAAPGSAERKVRLSELFADGKDTLIVYSFMYGPKMAQPCVSCTSILDALDGEAPHVMQRITLAVVAKSPITRIMEFTTKRGWHNLRLLSSADNTHNQDYHSESPEGDQWPVAGAECFCAARRCDSSLLQCRAALRSVRTGTGRSPRRYDMAAVELVRSNAGRSRREVVSKAFVLSAVRCAAMSSRATAASAAGLLHSTRLRGISRLPLPVPASWRRRSAH
jgi:predicted dithiol-disulfide oxidoreductase (DUF899 family)